MSDKIIAGLKNLITAAPNPKNVAKSQLQNIKDAISNDLEGYKNAAEWLHDFYPDFSWNPKDLANEIAELIKVPEFKKVATEFKKKFKYDLQKDLESALKEAKEESN